MTYNAFFEKGFVGQEQVNRLKVYEYLKGRCRFLTGCELF